MKSRVCKKCNWEFPLSFTKTTCRFCKTPFDEQVCSICKDIKPNELFHKYKNGINKGHFMLQCKPCILERTKKYAKDNPDKPRAAMARKRERANNISEAKYEKWLKLTELHFKPVTEEQWIEACSYFEGCAICGEEHIESRQFFVPFEEGGRYAAWNIFPMCGKCSTYARKIKNPFKWIDRSIGTASLLGLTPERSERLQAYLLSKIEEVTNEKIDDL